MGDRVCIRGCVVPNRHYESCPEASPAARLLHAIFHEFIGERCTGCLPREAYDGAMICERCIRRTRRALEDAADLCGHIRTLIDPRKAQVFDRENINAGKAVDAPAPMNVSMIDAADQVIITLAWWAEYYGADWSMRPVSNGWPSSITPEQAFDVADGAAGFLLEQLPVIANDSMVKGFTDKIIGWPAGDEWSVVKALKRFPMDERSFWSKLECPNRACGKRTVWVTPPRTFGQKTLYACKACGWVPPILEGAVWDHYFERKAP